MVNDFQGPDGHPGDVGERGLGGTDGEKVHNPFFFFLLIKPNPLIRSAHG